MMTLEEVWENLRQDPEIKATMEEVEKSYKLFKKIENLIVADLKAKLAESAKEIERLREKENLLNLIVDGYYTPTNIVKRQIREQNQTAIAVLKKVKKLFEEKYAYDVEESDFAVIYEDDVDEIIDNQIKQLKEKK